MTAIELTEAWQEFGMAFEINFLDFEDVRLQIPRSPGIYRIYTDTPIDILESFGQRHDPRHTNLQARIAKTTPIPEEFKIIQDGNNQYCIYNGHAATLRQRAREHFLGTAGTACLAAFELEALREYNWSFEFLNLELTNHYIDSEGYRTFLEQVDRNTIGWPILCAQ